MTSPFCHNGLVSHDSIRAVVTHEVSKQKKDFVFTRVGACSYEVDTVQTR